MGEPKFISDLHLGHENILSFDNRPFLTIKQHDEFIVQSWNDKVDFDDDVYILGDVSFVGVMKTAEYLNRMNGNKHLIIGNHDRKMLKSKEFRDLFVEIAEAKEMTLGDKYVVLSHTPQPSFNRHYYGAYHFYGHVHTSFEWNINERTRFEMEELYGVPCKMFNVGCMVPYISYTPKTLEEIENGYNRYRGIITDCCDGHRDMLMQKVKNGEKFFQK